MVSLSYIGCRTNKKEIINDNEEKINIDNQPQLEQAVMKQDKENFEFFLSKFINDSVFRYNRIKFPIKGFNSDTEFDKRDYLWTREDWDFYSVEDLRYKKDENIISEIVRIDSSMNWRLYKENSGYDINYRFKFNNNKWYLDYYSYKNF